LAGYEGRTKRLDGGWMTKPFKRLFFDIETAPNIAMIWQPGYKISVGHDNIIKERAIICVAWKWEGQKKIHCLTWDKNQCDKKLLQEFIKVMHEADEIVTHNGDRFDTPWIRTRCLLHGIPMSPDFVSIDTLKAARSKFKFNSNQLNYIAKFLSLGQKKPTGFQLWKDICLHKCPKALKKMVDYCKHDVRLQEQVWDKMNSYLPVKTNRADDVDGCPECGSFNTTISNHRVTAQGTRRIQFQCQDCGKYHTVAASKLLKL
jgi:uncharacterized protein YprB with RNaseH-like and TPR domain